MTLRAIRGPLTDSAGLAEEDRTCVLEPSSWVKFRMEKVIIMTPIKGFLCFSNYPSINQSLIYLNNFFHRINPSRVALCDLWKW